MCLKIIFPIYPFAGLLNAALSVCVRARTNDCPLFVGISASLERVLFSPLLLSFHLNCFAHFTQLRFGLLSHSDTKRKNSPFAYEQNRIAVGNAKERKPEYVRRNTTRAGTPLWEAYYTIQFDLVWSVSRIYDELSAQVKMFAYASS